jgi:tRNA threonylcarbamoyladenosine biosynthesis protein TsaB
MAYILSLETSTTVCSVAVTANDEVLSLREVIDAKSHASQLIPFISEALEESSISPKDLSAIAVSKGPGSYTGLRIGVSTAKGLAYGLKIPLISLDTLFCMASGFLEVHPEFSESPNMLLCPMIDARRMEVYSVIYNTSLKEIRNIKAEIIQNDSFNQFLYNNTIHFFGDGAMKCERTITGKTAVFHEGFHPSATYMGRIALKKFKKGLFENLAYFEPFYLKDFVTTIPINKVF